MADETKHATKQLVDSLCNINNIAYIDKIDSNGKGKTWLMNFVEGNANTNEAWFLKMHNDDNVDFVAIPQKMLNFLIINLQHNHEERLRLMLRCEISELMPIDMEDTMAVAMHELEKYRLSNGSMPMVDVQELAQRIKAEHPNLFLTFPNISNIGRFS